MPAVFDGLSLAGWIHLPALRFGANEE